MEIYQIKQFIAVVDTGSFTRGAARVAVSQPALSATIAKLEQEFGVALLDRKRNAVVPTPAGKHLYAVGTTILQSCNTLKANIRAGTEPRVLRVGIVRTLPTTRIASLIRAFGQSHPEIMVGLVDATATELDVRLQQKKLDVCLTILQDGNEADHSLQLFEERYVAVVNRSHRFATLPSITLDSLQDEPFIVRTGCEMFDSTTKTLLARGIRTKVVYKTDQDDRVLGLITAGLGSALMPASFCHGEVVGVPIADFSNRRTIGVQWDEHAEHAEVGSFVSFAKSHQWAVH